jgi:hypothetical protein
MSFDDPQVGSDWNPWSSIPPELNLGEATTCTNVLNYSLLIK